MPHTVDVVIEQRGSSLEQLTNATGLSAERIESIVNGRWTPSPDERAKIADALGIAVEEISWGHTMNPRNVRYHQFGLPDSLSDSKN
jgi:lambda repressor-like predicted transcriptional regulator